MTDRHPDAAVALQILIWRTTARDIYKEGSHTFKMQPGTEVILLCWTCTPVRSLRFSKKSTIDCEYPYQVCATYT